MLFNSLEFLAFFPAVYILYLFLEQRKQNWLLLAASYVFYAAWDWRFLALIWITTLANFRSARAIYESSDTARRRGILVLCLILNLGILAGFKYFNFFAETLHALLDAVGLSSHRLFFHIALPVGISFYTFQALGYTIDVYRGKLAPEKNLRDFALFVAYFPQLVAGPIERAGDLLPQLKMPRIVGRKELVNGFWFLFWGFFLKLLLADNLAPVANTVFSSGESATGPMTLLSLYAFAFQIFGDFAGYSFIALGLSSLLGIRLSVNFRFPYFVTNPRDFWRHWHITLSNWFRDYLYIPLGGRRGQSRFRWTLNVGITMGLGGLWHGASWNFVLWGLYHAVLLWGYEVLRHYKHSINGRANPGSGRKWLGVLLNFHLICLGWLFFRAESMDQIVRLLGSLFSGWNFPAPGQSFQTVLQILFYSLAAIFIQFFQQREDTVLFPRRLERYQGFVVLALVYLFLIWGEYGTREFIYFRF